ncbi:MAG: methyltransferase [Ignavibacteriota bacterium]
MTAPALQEQPTERMMQMITGYWVTQTVHAAAAYSVADHLATASATADDIARAEGIDPIATFRLLRACASLGLLTYDGKSRFAATPLLDTLRKDHPKTLRGLALSMAAPGHWLPWGRFADAVKSGRSQTIAALGAELFDYFTANTEEGNTFTDAMTNMTSSVAEEMARVIDTTAVEVVADIGGAGGALLHALLRANPGVRGVVFDRPSVVASAEEAARKASLGGRVTAVGGDFFHSVPEADLYLLKYILHDWDDASCIRILRSCRRGLRPGGRIAVIELLLPEIGEPGLASILDLNMMVMCSGRERSVAEYRRLFEAAWPPLPQRDRNPDADGDSGGHSGLIEGGWRGRLACTVGRAVRPSIAAVTFRERCWHCQPPLSAVSIGTNHRPVAPAVPPE